jgi:hypothetical protein
LPTRAKRSGPTGRASQTCSRFNSASLGQWRDAVQAKGKWIGTLIADVLGLDVDSKTHRTKVAGILKTWIASGALRKVTRQDENRHSRTFVEVGEWAN